MKNKKLITTYLILISFFLFSTNVYAKTLMIGDDNADITHFFGKVGIGTASPGRSWMWLEVLNPAIF